MLDAWCLTLMVKPKKNFGSDLFDSGARAELFGSEFFCFGAGAKLFSSDFIILELTR